MTILEDIRNDLRSMILPMLGRETPLAVTETLEALWEDEKRPQIHAKKKLPNGYSFTLALPAGISFADFLSKQNYFRDHAGGNKCSVSITQSGKMAILTILQTVLDDFYPYPVEPLKGILPVPIGYSVGGLQTIDLAMHEHLLIGGETGSGKTFLLNAIIKALRSINPKPLLMIIDLKKSGDYAYLEDDEIVITDTLTACQALYRLKQEMQARQDILHDARCKDIMRFHKQGGEMPWFVLIIDELAQLKIDTAQELLEDLLALSRAAGFRIICATQRPSCQIFKKKSFGDAKANFTITVCLKTRSAVDSKVILGSGEAAKLPKIKGRGILQIGCDMIEIQVPYYDPEADNEQLSAAVLSEELPHNGTTERVGLPRLSASPTLTLSFGTGGAKEAKIT